MRLRYIFNKETEQHPFHVKSNWEHPVQKSVALETYLEEVRVKLAEIEQIKPRNNLPFKERKALRELRSNSEIIIKKANKGTTTVIMNKTDKIQEGQVQLDDRKNYMPLETLMGQETKQRVEEIINDLHQGDTIARKVTSSPVSSEPRIWG